MNLNFSGRRAVAVPLVSLALTASPMLVASPVQAAAAVPCVQSSSVGKPAPIYRRAADTSEVTPAQVALLPAMMATPAGRVRARSMTSGLAARVVIPVYVHVIKGRHRKDRYAFGGRKVNQLIGLLNRGFAGAQLSGSPVTRYTFKLRHVDYTRRDGWYHAYLMGPRDLRMKRALHRGNAHSLNLYVNGGGTPTLPVLGWSTFPWEYHTHPRLDSVTVNHEALPRGDFKGYNLGDTVVHETGHWMGLLHTFQGGCGAAGDMVADTPSEAEPSFYCEVGRDSCPDQPGTDPVHNFMDYSLDSCMNTFTAGQLSRMDIAFAKWRR